MSKSDYLARMLRTLPDTTLQICGKMAHFYAFSAQSPHKNASGKMLVLESELLSGALPRTSQSCCDANDFCRSIDKNASVPGNAAATPLIQQLCPPGVCTGLEGGFAETVVAWMVARDRAGRTALCAVL